MPLRDAFAGLFASLAVALPLDAALAATAPPQSDGSSGSFSAYINAATTTGYSIYTSNGHFYGCTDVCGLLTTFPFKTIRYNGQKLHAFEFTDFILGSGINVAVVGATPALFLSQGDISVAGTLTLQNGGIGGAVSNGTTSSNGSPGGGAGGGGGGSGRGGPGGPAPCSGGFPVYFTGGGGGGGGNYAPGLPGLVGFHYADSSAPSPAGGAGGANENPARLQGGGGGGAPGGGDTKSNEYSAGVPGGNGGGSVVFSTPGAMAIASTGVLDARGGPGVHYESANGTAGLAGGGAGGDIWLFAGGGVTNAGQMLAHGGAGAMYTAPQEMVHEFFCSPGAPVVDGPNGGNGAGGVVRITALSIDNSGLIDVSEGAGGTAHGGLVATAPKRITNTGQIIGRLGYAQ